jgi:uncharacterized membrane protein YhaH (DUF805 family)
VTSPSVAAPRPLPARATPDRARRTELWMLLFAVLIGTLAVVAVNLGTGRPWASQVGLFGGAGAPAPGPARGRGPVAIAWLASLLGIFVVMLYITTERRGRRACG